MTFERKKALAGAVHQRRHAGVAITKGRKMQQFQQYIDGAFSDGATQFDSLDPATGKVWAQMPEASAEDVNQAVEAAERAFFSPDWAGKTATARGKLLYRLADLIAENAPRLADLETRDTGKIIRETSAQIAYVAEYYRYYAGLADKIEGAHLPIDKPDMDVWLRREPIGVVAAVVPWNSQLFLSAVKIGPALAAGCTVVLKASEEAPAPMLEFARIFDQAGFPIGVLNVITGGPVVGATLDQPSQGWPMSPLPEGRKLRAISCGIRPRIWPRPRWNSAANRRSSFLMMPISKAP